MACPFLRGFRSTCYYYCGKGECLAAIPAEEIRHMPCFTEGYGRCFRFRTTRLMQRPPKKHQGDIAAAMN